jgi:hypothetical protein
MSLNPAQAGSGPNLFRESTVKKPSTLDQKLADLKISELPSIQRVQAKQEKMLRLMKRSQADPVSYAGLEYCTAEYCGRVNCSEACWFGTLRRRVPEVLAIRRLTGQHEGSVHKIIVWKPDWGCPFGRLHCVKPGVAKALMTRVFNSMCSMSVAAVGTFKVVPFGTGADRYFSEIHLIVVGAHQKDLEDAFSSLQPEAGVRIEKVDDPNDIVDQVTSCNSLRLYQQDDDRPEAAQLTEFYTWLANMKLGARLFRYGCDENFDLITYRTIRWKPRIKKSRPGRRRYYKRRKWKPYRPWDASSGYYDDD